jgi:hypothetical protein
MPSRYLPEAETAYVRTVLLAVELLDAVTLEPVTRDVRVAVTGLGGRPLTSAGGRLVWLAEGTRRPGRVLVDPGSLPYDAEDVPAPPLPPEPGQVPENGRLLRVWLRPSRGYPFPDGATLVRGRIRETADETADETAGAGAVLDAEVWLEWQDEATGEWRNQRTRSFTRTRRGGEFTAFLRPAASRPAFGSDGLMPARLGVARGGTVRYTPQFSLREGRALEQSMRVAWSELD